MIPANKSRWMAAWLSRDAESRIRRSFSAVFCRGLTALRARVTAGPLLVVSNHTSWWDPLVLQVMCHRQLAADAYALMDAKNLMRLPFFRKVGAFGVDLDDARDGVRAMRYGAGLLDRPGRLVWLFPQGREVPVTVRPLGFRPGSAVIARFAPQAVVVPAALRYEFGKERLPSLWLSFGEPVDARVDVAAHERAVEQEMARIERALALGAGSEDFATLYSRRESLLFRAAEAALAWLSR